MAISTDERKLRGSLSPFNLAQVMKSAAGSKVANVTRFSSGYFLLKTNSSKQSTPLQKKELLRDIPVRIFPLISTNL